MNKTSLAALAVWLLTAPAWAQGGGMLDRLMAMDLNSDGAITQAEAETVRGAMFTRADTDRDGALSAAERSAVQGGAARGLGEADTDGDGRVTRAEAMAMPFRAFDRLDGDNDGVISAAELQAVRGRGNGG